MKKLFLPIFLIAALVLVSGCTQSGQTSTQSPAPTQTPTVTPTTTTSPTETLPPTPTETEVTPTESSKLCPAICNPLWQIRDNSCTFNRCGSGCGADGKTLFDTEAECKAKLSPTTIEITSSGFSPSTVTVNVGETVTFTNKDTNKHWPASAMHPTHKAYPGSDIAKCSDSVEKTKVFDACAGLEQGQSWSFTFDEKGTWKYHDHLNSGSTGTIVVE